MPSPVPAGYTRGPILFLRAEAAPNTTQVSEPSARLLQRLWNEAGAYGSRVFVIAVGSDARPGADALADLLRRWEAEQVTLLEVGARAIAAAWGGPTADAHAVAALQRATAILLVGEDPLWGAALLGGTPLAQAIRRANAQNKAVAAWGKGAAILCQHMAAWSEGAGDKPHVQFGPGLGIVNRVLLEATASRSQVSLDRLAEAVGYNPFLVGVGLDEGSGAVVYANAMLEAIGDATVTVLDGAGLAEAATPGALAGKSEGGLAALGLVTGRLRAGHTFNFDTRTFTAPADGDLSLQSLAH
ncbi:MAG: cyanophycinase, partial [Caldilineaceae bacterium]